MLELSKMYKTQVFAAQCCYWPPLGVERRATAEKRAHEEYEHHHSSHGADQAMQRH